MRICCFLFILSIGFTFSKAEPIIKEIGDFTYMIWHDSKLKWHEALKFCEDQNMKLLSLETEKKNNDISDFLREQGFVDKPEPGNDHIYWTSGHFIKKENTFRWEGSRKDFDETSWLNWLPGMPDNWRNDEYCVEIGFQDVGKWNDNRCWYHRHFICERSKNEESEAQ